MVLLLLYCSSCGLPVRFGSGELSLRDQQNTLVVPMDLSQRISWSCTSS